MTNDKKKKTSIYTVKSNESDTCPKKEGDNCLVPGVYSDSEPIGGA